MSEKLEDGGAAFPVQSSTWDYKGLTVRDWFAGQALAGLCANPVFSENDNDELAVIAYETADAMIAARKAGA
ncbi:hypothetical protein ACLMJV_16945 [Sinorhizobium meliloti]|uniref:hypothetical protein n=1 Tax=Rhizobium meliloti TaxID=382 RepID=UPI00398C9918